MSGAVGESIGVNDGALAALHVVHDGRLARFKDIAAGIGDGRDRCGRDHSLFEAADEGGDVLVGDHEVLRRHMVGVAPGVFRIVDNVGIDESGVSAAVDDVAVVLAGLEDDGLAAVGDGGQGRGHDFGEAVDVGLVVQSGGEGRRVEGVGVGPDGGVAGAVGVVVVEDHGSGAVGVEGGGAVHEDGRDDVAADVSDGIRSGCNGIHHAGHGVFAISRYA